MIFTYISSQLVLTGQIQNTGNAEMNSLLRDNTAVSRMMTTYTRRGPGINFLKTVLSSELKAVIEESTHSLEIDPVKVQKEELTVEGKENTEESLDKLIKSRVVILEKHAENFLKKLYSGIDQVPYGIRWICRQIKVLTKVRLRDRQCTQISLWVETLSPGHG